MEILLDTNFILTCVRQKIHFDILADGLFDEEIKWLLPQEVLNELGNLKDQKGIKRVDKAAAKLSFEVLQALNPTIINLNSKNPNVDIAIVNYCLGKEIVIATLDKDLKSRLANRVLTIKDKKHLRLID